MTDPVARAELLIRAPVADVFEAFVDPEMTARFWYSRGTARLVAGAELEWIWEMYGASTRVRVLDVEPRHLIRVDWDTDNEPTRVEWRLRHDDRRTPATPGRRHPRRGRCERPARG